jgi:hypothetical protein
MFNRILPVSLFCAFVLIISGCGGGMNILDIQSPISTASRNASLDSVARTIITASAFKGWQPEVSGEGHITATRHHTGHVAKVDITFTTESFNISYLDSDNMGYNGKTISPVYAQWVKELRDEIKRRLAKL